MFYQHTRRNLITFLGEDTPLRDISEGDADGWRLWLMNHEKLSPNTVRRRCGLAKQFFRAAVRKRLIDSNPFADLHGSVRGNPDRQYFVTREEAEKVLEACPDNEWRLLFALSRYGGLRCPSEHLRLRWSDVNWSEGKIVITSPKTEHHEGKGTRVIPLFPELKRYLDDAWEQTQRGVEYVIARYRNKNSNLRTHLCRIINRAGLKPWPKLFHNLRATRQTELAESFPAHVVCKWMGNSRQIADEHYLQVTDDHYRAAVEAPAQEAAQKAAQQIAAGPRTASHSNSEAQKKPPVLQGRATLCDSAPNELVGGTGLEPVTSAV